MRPPRWFPTLLSTCFALGLLGACSSDEPLPVQPIEQIGTCSFEPLPPTARAGGVVTPGPVEAGVAEGDLGLPVGSALGAYTARAVFFGSDGNPDARLPQYSGAFVPSVGIETRPRVKALAIAAGGETVLLVHVDVGVMYDGVLFEVEHRLGPDFAGKVIIAASHSHSAPGHFTGDTLMQLGFGAYRERTFERMVSSIVEVAKAAIEAKQPAAIGVAHDPDFDPDDRVSHDRRGENNDLAAGDGKDHDLFVLRVDTTDGTPMAVVPIFGMHSTILSSDNNLATTDAGGAVERAIEERFDRPVLVMHMQQAAGDVSPGGSGGINCQDAEFCYNFARSESVGRYAVDPILATWERAGEAMRSELEVEMLTRVIPLGPDLTTIQARGGALRYVPYDPDRMPDRAVFDDHGNVLSPIDEFNVEFGAGLCGGESRLGQGIPGASDLMPAYASCSRIEQVIPLLEMVAGYDWYFEDPLPSCAATRTTLSALRLGEHLLVTLPGEPVNPIVERMRAMAPVERDAFIVLGYAQDHVGYILDADDWLRGGYESSINIWGPIEGEYIAESAMELAALALTPTRENGATGAGRAIPGPYSGDSEPDEAPEAGTIPDEIPSELFLREGVSLDTAQPPLEVPRLGLAHFVWIGEDPLANTPTVTLERELEGQFVTQRRRSGRVVRDQDILLLWTPLPLDAESGRTHYWVAEWQATSPWGTTEHADELAYRAALPLGRYRFHVEGQAYSLNSRAFDVVPGSLDASAERQIDTLVLDIAYHAPLGFRLLDLAADSNQRVPLRHGTVELLVTFEDDADFAATVPVQDGIAHVDLPSGSSPLRDVTVRDPWGNEGTIP